MISPVTDAIAFIREEVVPYVNDFRMLQDVIGRISHDEKKAVSILKHLRLAIEKTHLMLGYPPSAIIPFNQDIDLWLHNGLSTPPTFDKSLAAFIPPEQHRVTFFIAPLTLTNGLLPHGAFLECFAAYRDEPQEVDELVLQMPSPLNICQSYRLLAGSKGLLHSNCLVVFPENISTAMKVTKQTFAFSFSSKFQAIFTRETLPRAIAAFGQQEWASQHLSSENYYKAHCMWSYLHDYFHQQGPRPLHTNFSLKMKFFTGILEETKVDVQTMLYVYENKCVFSREICEFILLERLLRYPCQDDASNNFDAGAGLLLFTWLLQEKAGLYKTHDHFTLSLDECVHGLVKLVEDIESIEHIQDDNEYRSYAKDFVRVYLPAGVNKARFAIPTTYQKLIETIEI